MRLLKFDTIFPYSYFEQLKAEAGETLRRMDYNQYYDWLMGQRLGMSDFLTFHMNAAGWKAREFLAKDGMLLEKLIAQGALAPARRSSRIACFTEYVLSLRLRDLLALKAGRDWARHRREWLTHKYIEAYAPDVICLREPTHVDGKFFDLYRGKCTIVSFIGCNTDHALNWEPHRSDVIFTLTREYLDFFRAQGIETHLFEYGVDERVAREVQGLPKKYDCTFVGALGQPWQSQKTQLMDAVAQAVDFKWWGLKGDEIGRFPALERSYQGVTAGIEMLRIYRQSKIVLNDYVDTAAGQNVNIRTKEVLGVGSLLLTREAENIRALEGQGALASFKDADDCIGKIRHFLSNDEDREKIAAKGLRVALERFSYRDVAKRMMDVISDAHARKRPRLKAW